MNVTAWRIVKAKHLATAFNGDGARLYGGRWNSKGTPMVYAAASEAVAVLEMLVHLNASELLKHYYLIPVSLPETSVRTLDVTALPTNWSRHPAPASVRRIGDQWIAAQSSLALRVPSVVAPGGYNILINVMHPKFNLGMIGLPQRYRFDRRLR